MKEIKSNKYLRKQAIYGQELPIGDPGLPGNISEKDIPGAGPEPIGGKTGDLDVDLKIVFQYSYDNNFTSSMKITSIVDKDTGTPIFSEYFDVFEDEFADRIENEIEIIEKENPPTEPSEEFAPGYDRHDQDSVW